MDWLILAGSLLLLVAGAEVLIRGASAAALRLGVSPLFVGLTIVGFGTSSPELVTSVVSTLNGKTDISVGNVVGSNVFNIAVILGLSALIRPIAVQIAAIRRDLAFMVAAAITPLPIALAFGSIPQWTGPLLFAVLVWSIIWAARESRRATKADQQRMTQELDQSVTASDETKKPMWLSLTFIAAGLALLILGSNWFVGSASAIARTLGVSELIIGLTVVAAGTSMPELVTSTLAAFKKNADIAIGNIIGSNIFNVFGILGVAATIGPQTISRQSIILDIPVMILTSLALIPLMASGRNINRLEGSIMLAFYAAYLAVLIFFAPTWFPMPAAT